MNLTTVVPDTNVWSYIVEADAVETVRRAAKANNVTVVACPAVVYECLRVSDRRRRRRLARALTRTSWHRPMPEAYLEAEELRNEIRRLRPEWIVQEPDLRMWSLNRSDWYGGFWRRVHNRPDWVAEAISEIGDDRLSRAREAAKAARQYAQELGHTSGTLRLADAKSWYLNRMPGWDGDPFDTWRAFGQQRWWNDLITMQHRTSLDWLEPWLELSRIRRDRASWIAFWTREVSQQRLARQWIRWAMTEVQAVQKVTPGTPVDNQIATYLRDFDIFVTADRRFAQCIDLVRPYSPVPLARASVSPAGNDAIDHLLEVFSSDRVRTDGGH